MPDRRRTRSQERTDDIDISPTALLAIIETLTAERDAATKVSEDYLVALQRERAEFLNFKRRTAEERDRDLGLAAEDLIRKVLVARRRLRPRHRRAPGLHRRGPVVRGHRRHRSQAAHPPRERGRDVDRRDAGHAVRSTRTRGDRHRRRHRPARGRDRRDRPPRLSTARPRPAAGPRGRRRGTHHRHRPFRHPALH